MGFNSGFKGLMHVALREEVIRFREPYASLCEVNCVVVDNI